MTRTKYRRIEKNTVANIALIERLVTNGWRIIRTNLFADLLEKKGARK